MLHHINTCLDHMSKISPHTLHRDATKKKKKKNCNIVSFFFKKKKDNFFVSIQNSYFILCIQVLV